MFKVEWELNSLIRGQYGLAKIELARWNPLQRKN